MKFIHILCVIPLLVCSCMSASKENKSIEQPAETKMYLCQADTSAVIGLVNTFLSFYKDGRYSDAAAMLYCHPVGHTSPEMLDNEQLQSTISTLKSLPIVGFKISNIEFNYAEDTSVKCELFINDYKTIGMTFSPVRYLGQWKLCLK